MAEMAESSSPRKRVLARDLEARIIELERKVTELTEEVGKLRGQVAIATAGQPDTGAMSDQLTKLNERVEKIATSLAQVHLGIR